MFVQPHFYRNRQLDYGGVQMQNRCVDKIEKSFAVFSIDRGSPDRVWSYLPMLTQILTSVTLPRPPPDSHSLNTHLKLNNLSRHRCLACLPPHPVSNRTSCSVGTSVLTPLRSLSHIDCEFTVFQFASDLGNPPRSQSYCSARALPTSPPAQNC